MNHVSNGFRVQRTRTLIAGIEQEGLVPDSK